MPGILHGVYIISYTPYIKGRLQKARKSIIFEDRILVWDLQMNTVHERIREIRSKLGVSQVEFAKRILISKSFYGYIELGKKNINDRIIQLISSQFNVNKEWIKTGEGDMFTSPPPDLRLGKLTEIYNELDGSLRDCLIEQANSLLKLKKGNKDE
jgi:transcriptional regulator with XRE-family HTH domain